MEKICVIGAGIWGTVMAHRLASRNADVVIWAHEGETAENINLKQENTLFAPKMILHPGLKATDSFSECEKADILINAVPVQYMEDVWSRFSVRPGIPVINLSKGIENRSMEFPAEILSRVTNHKNPVYALSGPSFAREVYQELHTAVVLAGKEGEEARRLQALLSDETLRVYRNEDLTGVEVAGALKNVIAVGAGIIDGISSGMNTQAAVITRGVAETMRLGRKMGAKESTFLGLAGFGDFILTCTHAMSRNFTFGRILAQTASVEQALEKAGGIVEGYYTLKSAVAMGQREQVELPIMDGLYRIIYQGEKISDVISVLMSRDLKSEWGAYSS